MAPYAFAIKEACQYLNVANLVQTYKADSLVEQRSDPCPHVEVGNRYVNGFFKRKFNVAEMNTFLGDLSTSARSAPPAERYFQHFLNGVEVHTWWPLYTESRGHFARYCRIVIRVLRWEILGRGGLSPYQASVV